MEQQKPLRERLELHIPVLFYIVLTVSIPELAKSPLLILRIHVILWTSMIIMTVRIVKDWNNLPLHVVEV